MILRTPCPTAIAVICPTTTVVGLTLIKLSSETALGRGVGENYALPDPSLCCSYLLDAIRALPARHDRPGQFRHAAMFVQEMRAARAARR